MADPDLQIRRGGGGHPHPERRGGTGLQKNFFPPFGPHFGRKVRGGQAPRAHPLDPPLSVVAVKSVVAIRASTTHTTVTRATALSGGFRGGARVACPPPYLSTKMRPGGPKKIFLETAPPLSQGLDDRPPPYLKVRIRH